MHKETISEALTLFCSSTWLHCFFYIMRRNMKHNTGWLLYYIGQSSYDNINVPIADIIDYYYKSFEGVSYSGVFRWKKRRACRE